MTLRNSKSWPLPLVQLRVDSSDGGRTYRTYAHDDCIDSCCQYTSVNISSHKRLKDDIRRWNNGYTGFNRYYDTLSVRNSILSPYLQPNVIVTECQTHCDNNGRSIPSKVYNIQTENGDCNKNKIEDNSKPALANNARNNIDHNQEQIEIQSPKNEKLVGHDGNENIVKTSATLFRPPVLRTDTVSTILDQETETDDVDNYDAIHDYDDPTTTHHNTSNPLNHLTFNCQQHPPPRGGSSIFHDRYHVLALARINEQHEHCPPNAQQLIQRHAAPGTAHSTTREDVLYHRRRTCDLKVDDGITLVCPVHQRNVTVNNSSAIDRLLSVPGNSGLKLMGCDCDKSCKVVGQQLKMQHQDTVGALLDSRKVTTLKRHYYPEGGWGWIIIVCTVLVHILNHGIQLSCALLIYPGAEKFKTRPVHVAGWLGAMSTGVALLISPVTIAFCRKKSTRVTAVMGGLITALGCLFTSFATQFHQLFFSYGTVVGIGVGITRDCSTLMVAQYFKRRREFVEIFIVSGSGLGIAIMSLIIRAAIGALGWRLGLQVVTGTISATFILGTFYRSASLYHPQRRAILHIKNQKRKIKDKNKVDDRVPFFDFSTLKSKTVRILLVSTGISAFGINTPLFYLAYQAESEGLSGDSTVLLQLYLGLAWTVGCVMFSTLVLHSNGECRIARQYLTQTAVLMCGLSILVFTTAVSGNYHAYVMFAWIYGIFCGGYHYSLKMYTYERVRARNFARTWGFVQCSQAIPIVIGVPFSGYISERCGDRAGYYFSSTCVIVGSLTLFLVDLHRRNIARHKHTRANGTRHLCVSETCPQRRRLSFTQEPDVEPNAAAGPGGIGGGMLVLGGGRAAGMMGGNMGCGQQAGMDNINCANDKPELTCISEEGIADMDIPDNLLDDLDYIGDCITSCNKVENYLMLSEFENNLIAEMPVILDRKGRRWSLARSKAPAPTPTTSSSTTNCSINNAPALDEDAITVMPPEEHEENGCSIHNSKWKAFPNRVITVIDESSV